ncbi:MAG: SRPBCC family protein [Nitriliruptorales bacterium]|nr:SRPBCC family protein [Nitriliruptorales bacterium]
MARYVATVATPREAGAALDFVADFTNLTEWDPGIVSAERVDDGPLAVGARFATVIEFRNMALTYELVEYVPGERALLVAEGGGMVSRDLITVEPTDDGSRLTYDATLTLSGFLKVLDPLLAIGFNRVAGKAVAGLEEALEGTRVA